MIFLSIETSCDDTSVALFEDYHLKVMKTKSQDIHKQYGGVIPELASREHTNDLHTLIDLALNEANFSLKNLQAIVVTQGPGLINALQIGLIVAKTLASILKIDLYLINHLEGHLYSPFINQNLDIIPKKALVLLVSGGHTMLFKKNEFNYQLISQTRDDAVGEAFDKVGRILNLDYPGGKVIDQLFQKYDQSIPFPKIAIPLKDSVEFSYSGLKSKILSLVKDNDFSYESIAYGFARIAIEQLYEKTKKVYLSDEDNLSLIVAGGVSANSYLRALFSQDKDIKTLFVPDLKFTTDNAAMIGTAFYHRFEANKIKPSPLNSDAIPRMKLI